MWEFHEICAVDGCENIARSWFDLTDEQKDAVRATYGDACLCDDHKSRECGAWDEGMEYRCTRYRGHGGKHNGVTFRWDGKEMRLAF